MTEAFRNIPGPGPLVIEQHWGVETANDEHILPAHWQSTIKPGDCVFMKMYREHPLLVQNIQRKCYDHPPYAPTLRETSDRLAASMRQDRFERVHWPNGRPPFGIGRAPNLPGVIRIHPHIPDPEREAWARKHLLQLHQQQQREAMISSGIPKQPAPPMEPFGGGFRPAPTLPAGIHVVKSAPSVTTVDEDELTEAEKTELTFVNFVEERRKATGETAADLLARCTELRDISGCFEHGDFYISSDSSGSDSDDSSRIIDD